MNPSLATRLRVGFAVLLILLGGVTVVGVARLFQLRHDYENAASRAFDLEVAAERMGSTFVLEQAALVGPDNSKSMRRAYRRAVASAKHATAAAQEQASGDDVATGLVTRRAKAEETWRRTVAAQALTGNPPSRAKQRRTSNAVLQARVALASHAVEKRQQLRDKVADDTRHTLTLVLVGLAAAIVAAALFFFGLVNSMREPLAKLVAAAKRLAARDLDTRVEVSGPVETAALGRAFNEMASELQTAYGRIEEVRNQLAVTVSSLSDGLITVDERAMITQLNPSARALVPEAAMGGDAGLILDDAAAGERLRELVSERERGELRITIGSRVLSIVVSPLGGGKGAVLSVRDVSERARIERLKDEFVATVSHELRSPLTSVKGFAELLMIDRDNLTEEQAANVEIILHGTSHLVDVLNDLLDLARSDAGRLTIKPIPCNVEELISEVVELNRPRVRRKSQELDVTIDENLPPVLAEPARFKQVLGNLLINANEYTPDGGRIAVSAATVGPEIEVAVSDTGPGIPPEKLDEVFDRFTRLDASETQLIGGSGLGLAISKSLVELHGGAIGASSVVGEGSTFRFVLPAATTHVRDDTTARS